MKRPKADPAAKVVDTAVYEQFHGANRNRGKKGDRDAKWHAIAGKLKRRFMGGVS